MIEIKNQNNLKTRVYTLINNLIVWHDHVQEILLL